MERLSLSQAASVTKTLEDGTRITARKVETPRPKPSDVAEHEALHVVAAGEIVSASIIPSGDALGTTHPVKMTAAAAAAPEALGHKGTGWDMYLTEHILGVDPGTAKAVARSALSGRYDEVEEVAITLEEKGTIYQFDVQRARQKVIEKRHGIFEAVVEINQPGENTIRISTKTFQGEVKISDLLPSKSTAEIIPFPTQSKGNTDNISDLKPHSQKLRSNYIHFRCELALHIGIISLKLSV